MRFLVSVSTAVVNRSPEELFGGLLVASAVAVLMVGLFVLARRKGLPSATFVGTLLLSAGVLCMIFVAGYIEHTEPNLYSARPGTNPAAIPGWFSTGPSRNLHSQKSGFFMPGWTPGFHVVVAADVDHDGHVTADELLQLVKNADTDADGSVDPRDIDRLLASRFATAETMPSRSSSSGASGGRVENHSIDNQVLPSRLEEDASSPRGA
jgi:hypothetical protein